MKRAIMLLLACLLPFNLVMAQEAETEKAVAKKKEEKPVTIADFEKQFKVCREMMDVKNDRNKPIVSSGTKSSILNYIRNARRYFDQNRFNYAEENIDRVYGYSVPEMVRVEFKELTRIFKLLIKQSRDKLVEKGEVLYQKAIDITNKKASQDDVDNLKDKIGEMREDMSNVSSSDTKIKRIRNKLEKASRFLGYWGPVCSAQEDGDFSKAIENLQNLVSSYSSYSILPTKVLRAKIAALREEANTRFDKEVAVMRKELLKAKDSEAVKNVFNKFKVFSSKYSRGFRDTTKYNDLNYSQQALEYWLNVITTEESGDYRQAVQSLNNLESSYYRNTLLLKWKDIKAKKEELVKKMLTAPKVTDPIVKAVAEQIKKCKDLDSLLAFKTKLQELTNNYSNNRTQELYYLQSDLQALANMYKVFKSGQFNQVFQYLQYQNSNQQSHRWQDLLQKHREELRIKAVAAIADIDVKILAKKDKSPDKVLLAIADKAAEEQDWGKVLLLLDAYAMAFYPNNRRPVWLQGEIAGCRCFITGDKFEKAGMLSEAIANYTSVLQQTGSKRLPTKEAINRLKKLRDRDPELFENQEPVKNQPAPIEIEEELDDVEVKPVRQIIKGRK